MSTRAREQQGEGIIRRVLDILLNGLCGNLVSRYVWRLTMDMSAEGMEACGNYLGVWGALWGKYEAHTRSRCRHRGVHGPYVFRLRLFFPSPLWKRLVLTIRAL